MRRRYLVAYDIANPKRLRHVAKSMKGWGYRFQYSLFLCDLNGRELIEMRQDLVEIAHHHEDSIVIIDLGEVDRWDPHRVETIGIDKDDRPEGPYVY